MGKELKVKKGKVSFNIEEIKRLNSTRIVILKESKTILPLPDGLWSKEKIKEEKYIKEINIEKKVDIDDIVTNKTEQVEKIIIEDKKETPFLKYKVKREGEEK